MQRISNEGFLISNLIKFRLENQGILMSLTHLKKLFVYFLVFNIQLNSTFIHSPYLLQFNTTYSQEDENQNEFETSNGKKQATELDLSSKSRAQKFGTSILTTITMLVIGSVGINMIKRYSVVSYDSKLFSIGAITYFVGELVSLTQSIAEMFQAKADLDSKQENIQIETLEAIYDQQKENQCGCLLEQAQTAASMTFGTALAYSLKLYIEQGKDIAKTELALKAAQAEQQKTLAMCTAQDPSLVLISQPGADPSTIGKPYYSVLCPKTLIPLTKAIEVLNKKLNISRIRNTIYNPFGSGSE